ncbi:MAG: hypothetical protein AAB875_03315, partial [Patescibacteria group bacterium]
VTTATHQPTPVATPQPDHSIEKIAHEPTPPPPAEPTRKKNPILWIAITLFVLALLAAGAYVALNKGLFSKQKACTQDAKVCPDGTSVGRTGPNCEFAPCPTPPLTPEPTPEASPSETPNETPTATGSATPTSSPSASPSS